MDSISPVLPFSAPLEIQVAESQPEFRTLPSFHTRYSNISRWRLSPEERLHIMNGGDLFIAQLNGNSPLQPVMPMAMDESLVLSEVLKVEEGLGLK